MESKALEALAKSIRSLSIDAIEQAKSGHPGLPLGCAEFGAVLYGTILRHSPDNPAWPDRDRFVLSAGHGSMLLYSLLHLSGYPLPIEEIRRFRQLGSLTPGHPEYGHTVGVETTTGPLGQGLANAVGLAMAETMLAARFNTPQHTIVNHHTYALVGDGCLMEGISYEAAALAGHLGLGKLVVYYDSNRITIEGRTDLAWSEDVAARFAAAGWHVQKVDAYDLQGLRDATSLAKDETQRPSLIIMKSTIGKGSPGKADSHEAHGAPLGADEAAATRAALGIPAGGNFHVEALALEFMAKRREALKAEMNAWQVTFATWSAANPQLAEQWAEAQQSPAAAFAALKPAIKFPEWKIGESVATRVAGGKMLNAIATAMPSLIGGSADLGPSNNSDIKGGGSYSAANRSGRILHFGIREHAMGAVMNGLALHGGVRPFGATFLVFADYMRPAVRLASLMRLPVTYVFTHDSIHVGEDGPTHQPIEHLASLRIIPGLAVLRPADAQECNEAWSMAMEKGDGPTALLLTRQNLPVFPKPEGWQQALRDHGAYVVRGDVDSALTLVASGSETTLALEAATAIEEHHAGLKVRVISVMHRERFLALPSTTLDALLGKGQRVVIEAGVRNGWEGIASSPRHLFTLDSFGHSGPGKDVAEHMGISTARVIARLNAMLD